MFLSLLLYTFDWFLHWGVSYSALTFSAINSLPQCLQILKGCFLSQIFTKRIVSNADARKLNTHCNEKCASPAFALIVIFLALKKSNPLKVLSIYGVSKSNVYAPIFQRKNIELKSVKKIVRNLNMNGLERKDTITNNLMNM